jgi:hypothetical protein
MSEPIRLDPAVGAPSGGEAPDGRSAASAASTAAGSKTAVPPVGGSSGTGRAPARPATGGAPDEAIPMLTEIVDVPRYVAEELPESLAEVDWGGLAERVRENVTERLGRRSQLMLDELLRDSLQAVVDRAADSLAAELRDSLSQMVRDIVARAVTEEITRVHAEISKRGAPGGTHG